ncbi:hypothetical protein G210_4821, partial [Candida maltosa Xu316]
MSTKTDQVITLAQVQSLSESPQSKKPLIWKEFGNYLDKSVDIHNPIDIANDSILNKFITDSYPDKSYLSQNIPYKVCTSCQRPIGLKSLESHYTKCVEMKQKRQQEIQENMTNNPQQQQQHQQKKKRGRGGALVDIEGSSVDSSRNTTPAPINHNNNNTNNVNSNTDSGDAPQPPVKPKK